MIKALIFDLDGTIVSPLTGRYSPAIAEAFNSLHRKGIILIAATGRSPYELQYTGMIDGLSFDAVVCLNGQYCYTETEDLFINSFPAEELNRILPLIEKSGFPCAAVQKERTTINSVNPSVKTAQDSIHMPVPEICSLSELHGHEILMLTVFVSEDDEAELLSPMRAVSATRWNPHAIDLVPLGSGKCHGTDIVLRHFGIGWEDVFAFGDGDNDYEMLSHAGKGFAMGNSSERLLNGAFEITDTVDNDGVIKALLKYQVL